MSEYTSLVDVLRALSDACAKDDARATQAPWTWTDEMFLWNKEIDHGVLNHGSQTHWPVSEDNREVIAASRNRLSELSKVMKDAARMIELLSALAIQDSGARDRLRSDRLRLESRILELETALGDALDLCGVEGPGALRHRLDNAETIRAVLERRSQK